MSIEFEKFAKVYMNQRVSRDHVPYDVWNRQGYLETTEGDVIHYGYIEKFIEELGKLYNIREIAFDRCGTSENECGHLRNRGRRRRFLCRRYHLRISGR